MEFLDTLFKNKLFKMIVILSLLLFIYVFFNAYLYSKYILQDLSDNIFRLHVVANSNSLEDQNLKYAIRDNLINYLNTFCNNPSSKKDVLEFVNNHISDFEKIASTTIKEKGFNYTPKVEIGNFDFPTKTYGDISLPSGNYDALKINLGNSSGQNWWCVLYPSLCFIDTTNSIVSKESKNKLQNVLSDEEYELISSHDDLGINIKFKFIEFLTQNKIITSKK